MSGEEFVTNGRTITEADLVNFAALTGDWHPQHADAAWAAGSEFGERVAHGMLVLSYAVGLAPIDPRRVLALRGLDKVAFKRPVRIGDTIRVEGKLDETRAVGGGIELATYRWRILNQRDEIVVAAKVTAVMRDGAEAPARPEESQEDGHEVFDEVYL